jgi:nucleoid-associated protein YgaU
MTATSISRMVVPSVTVVAACGAALFFGIPHLWRNPPVETHAASAAPAVSPPASGAREAGPVVLATAQTEANALVTAVAAPPRSRNADESAPTFDIARIERNGDAVIAGRAAPGATVELLRDGERHDRAVADQSGQFVMTPPRLPPGNYALTLISKLPDGTLATSRQDVAVALDPVESSPAAPSSRAELPFNVPDTKVTSRLRQDVALSRLPHTAAATTLQDFGSTPAVAGPRIATATVSRGDSLWRISRANYGVGTRYAVVYKANRDQIRDPNRIYPGQVFILPMQAR